jgi:hypothetical protein
MRILDGSDGPPGRFSSILYRQSASKGCASVVAFTKWKRPEDRLRACLGEGFLIVSSVVARRRAMSVFLVALTLAAAQSATKAWAAGAFAIGKCGAYGQAFDYAGEADALAAARKQCNGECPTTFTVKRACAAFSVDMTNPCGAHGYAVKPHISSSLNQATRECYKFGGKECVIRAWVCDAKG